MPISHSFVTKIVQAGAGTGKTESIATEIVKSALLFFKEHPGKKPHFVATTFTERATAELRERVLFIAERPEFNNPELLDFVRDTEKLEISTIHGVFARFLHRFAVLLGIDPEFTIMSEDDETALLQKVIRKILSVDPDADLLVDQYGFAGLVDLCKPLLNHYRLHGENTKGFSLWQQVMDREANELLDNLKFLSGADFSGNTGASFQLLARVAESLRRVSQDFPKLRSIFLETVGKMRKPVCKGKWEQYKEAIDGIFQTKERWGDEAYSVETNIGHDELAQKFLRVIKKVDLELARAKSNRGVLSFSDLEFLMAQLLNQYGFVKDHIAADCDFWFIDEYQDTSPLQKTILFSFFKTPWNAYFVGDPQQSIYLFRGANANVFNETRDAVVRQNGLLEKLEVNYRSQPDLLRFMNALFQPLQPKGPFENKTLAYIHLHATEVSQESVILNQILQWKSEGFAFQDMCVLVRTNKNAEDIAHYLSQQGVPVFVHTTGGFYDRREVLDALSILSFLTCPSDDLMFCTLARSPWVGISDTLLLQWAQAAKKEKKSIWSWITEKSSHVQEHFSLLKLKEAFQSLEEKPISVVFENILQELGFFELSLVGDASGKREANLRKLVSQLRQAETRPGFSSTRFISKVWPSKNRDSEEGEAASFIEPLRVNIMTIHKSKGLKFNCVIIPSCGQDQKTAHQPMEFASDGSFALQVLSPDAEEKVSSLGLKTLKSERAERELHESMRLFYVAVTRAADRLSLIAQKSTSPKGWLAKLDLGLAEGEHKDGYVVKNWIEPISADTIKIHKDEQSVDLQKLKFSPGVHSVQKLWETQIDLRVLIKSQQRGLAMHAIFEEIKRKPKADLKSLITQILFKFQVGDIDSGEIEKALRLNQPPLMKILNGGFAEWSFSFILNNKVYSGRVDLWGTVNDVTWIVDYKSASQLTAQLKDRVQKQLEFYAFAVHKTGIPWEKIRVVAVLPLTQEVFEPKLRSLPEIANQLSNESAYLDRILRDQTVERSQSL